MPQLDLRDQLVKGHPVPDTGKAENMSRGFPTATTHAVSQQDDFLTTATMRDALTALGYTSTQLDNLSENDMVYALRLAKGWVE